MTAACIATILGPGGALLAQADRVSDMARNFRPGGAELDWGSLVLLLLVAGGLVAVAIAAYRRFQTQEGRVYHHPLRLFRELSRAHGLDRRERRLLWRAAQVLHAGKPAAVFLQPERLATDTLARQLRVAESVLARLRERLA